MVTDSLANCTPVNMSYKCHPCGALTKNVDEYSKYYDGVHTARQGNEQISLYTRILASHSVICMKVNPNGIKFNVKLLLSEPVSTNH